MPPKKVKQSVNPNLLSILKAQKNPPIQPDLLQKVTEDEILSLDAEDAEQFWKDMNLNFKVHLKILIPEEPLQEEGRKEKNKVDDSLDFMKSVLNLLDQKANTADHYIPVIAVQMLIVLNGLILNSVFDEQLKIQTVKLCETWWKKNLIFRETLGENTIHYLLLKSLQNGAPKNVISRVCALRESLKENFHLERYLDIFSQISQNHSYLSSKDGQSFLGFIMALDQRIVRCIHESAKLFLVNNKKTAAVGYGRVYYLAWHSASGNLKKVIEDKCIQEFMEHIFTAHRQGLELSQLGQNIFVILREFHSHKIMSHVRTMLTDLYEPLLWRYLRSSNNIYRCNAAQVLFDVYPLERPGEGREEGLQLILKQHQIMDELLSDEYHVVRLIAVKGVCRILSEYWEVIPQNTIQRWMKIMTHNLVNDGSYPNVRQNVYIGFKYLINKPMSVEYMQQLLPELQNHFHDANAKVRAAFVDMLIACKENGIKYWNIVPLTHLLRRLEVEETEVGCLIVKLLFNSFYLYERGPHVTFKRIMNLILMNRNASRCFFLYSKPSLNTDRAIQLMISILVYMLQHVNTKLGITTKEGSNESQPPQKKKQKASSNRHNKNRNSSQSNESMETTAAEEIAARNADIYSEASLDNPIISLGFIEIVVILWKIHAADFNEAENKDQSKKFYNVCVHCLPTFLKYYKDTDVYTSLLFLCGVMPLSVMKVIRPLCNIESICLSQLKALTMDSSDEEILRLVQPLCFWNHGDNILETARLWIDDAFRIDDLNATFCKPRSEKRRVKIKDIHEPKPLLGFRLLNTIFSFAPNTEVILTKNYNHVLELWKYLERIMILIENRIRNGEPYEHSLLCDEFIEECFSRYLKLILHLKRKSEDNTFDACKAVTDVIDWAERCLIPVLPVENPLIEESSKIEWLVIETSGPLLVKLLNEILKISRNLIAFYHGNIDYYSKVIKFTKKVLSTGCKIKFVYSAMGLILQFCNNDYISQLDKRQLFKVLMPLFNLCIDSFTDIVYSKDNINRYVEVIHT